MTLTELLANVDLALYGPRTLYRLGQGGFYGNAGAAPAHPGTIVSPKSVLASMRRHEPAKFQRYVAAAAQAGIDLDALPDRMPACDCSGFVTWALGLPRAPSSRATTGWLDTTAIWTDAQGEGTRFEWCSSALEPRKARIGALLVYPDDGPDDGHVGIVTAIDESNDEGTATQVVHCAPENYLLPAAPGQRHAILQTSPKQLLDHPKTIAVWCVSVFR
ncbi:MAG TPA: CHAP domain-containing protein [Rubrivivax sp.]|nr:CHAP domain-containing protein [Rubrivivax sp.]